MRAEPFVLGIEPQPVHSVGIGYPGLVPDRLVRELRLGAEEGPERPRPDVAGRHGERVRRERLPRQEVAVVTRAPRRGRGRTARRRAAFGGAGTSANGRSRSKVCHAPRTRPSRCHQSTKCRLVSGQSSFQRFSGPVASLATPCLLALAHLGTRRPAPRSAVADRRAKRPLQLANSSRIALPQRLEALRRRLLVRRRGRFVREALANPPRAARSCSRRPPPGRASSRACPPASAGAPPSPRRAGWPRPSGSPPARRTQPDRPARSGRVSAPLVYTSFVSNEFHGRIACPPAHQAFRAHCTISKLLRAGALAVP